MTLDDFLAYFPPVDITKEEFIKQFTVTYSKPLTFENVFSLTPINGRKPIIKKKEDIRYVNKDKIIEYFYEIVIRNREKYLTCFYNAYFKFKDPLKLNWTKNIEKGSTPEGVRIISLQQNDASRRIVRQLFPLELLDQTKVTNTVKAKVSFWQSLDNMYNNLLLEDRMFAPSSIALFLKEKGTQREKRSGIIEINYNNLFYLFQAYQPKASIFNPYSIYYILKNILPAGKKLLTPVLSWGSYMISFMHSDYDHYVGIDVMKSVCDKNEFLADWYRDYDKRFSKKKTEIINSASEDLLNDQAYLKKYTEFFDTIVVCPPYYDMEIYYEGKQSIQTFPTYEKWLQGYWGQTIEMCYKVMKPGGTLAVIANDYFTLKKKHYPLTADLDKITQEAGFDFDEMIYLQNRTSPLRVNAKDRTERLFIYTK